jgi:hypothetical protein
MPKTKGDIQSSVSMTLRQRYFQSVANAAPRTAKTSSSYSIISRKQKLVRAVQMDKSEGKRF